MASFNVYIDVNSKVRNIPIYIQVIHQRKPKYISTPYHVRKSEIDKNKQIKDFDLRKRAFMACDKAKRVAEELEFQIYSLSPDELKVYIEHRLGIPSKNKNTNVPGIVKHSTTTRLVPQMVEQKIDFITFAKQYIEKIKPKQRGTAGNHILAINNLCKYTKEDTLPISEITSKFLQKYNEWQQSEGLGTRGQTLYLGSIKKIFNEAMYEYNDPEKGIENIRFNPFDRFTIPEYEREDKDRSLSVETIHKIKNYIPKGVRDQLAQDCFLLSIYLLGINSCDLYSCATINDNRLIYNRSKTQGRRKDKAKISIKIEPEIEAIIEKYRDYTGNYVFNFQQHYENETTFNDAINKGLRIIAEELQIENFTYYYARHSIATILANECHITDADIAKFLNHSSIHKITRGYIKEDWNVLDRTNRILIDFLNDSFTKIDAKAGL